MARAADLFPRDPTPQHGVMATVARAPIDVNDWIDVDWVVPGDGDTPEETATALNVRWTRRGNALPDVGDDALLMIDTEAGSWAIVW